MTRLSNWRLFVIIAAAGFILANIYNYITTSDQSSVITAIKNDLEIFGDISSGTYSRIEPSDASYLLSTTIFALAAISLIIALIGWTHAHSKLAHSVEPDKMRHSTGWAVGSWFVPILNLFRPKQILDDSIKINSPEMKLGLVTTWWALFLLTNLASNITSRMIDSAVTKFDSVENWDDYLSVVNEVTTAYQADHLSTLLGLSLGITTIVLAVKSFPLEAPRPTNDYSIDFEKH